MTEIEERLRRELKEYAERARPGSIRPLRAPAARRRARAVRWLAPATATVAVLGVITGVSLATGPAGRLPASLAPGGMPRYYVTAFEGHAVSQGREIVITMAAVHDSATGAALTTVRVPALANSALPGTISITAAADSRTFVLTRASSTTSLPRFYRLRVAADGRSASLSRLNISVPRSLHVSGAAVSPDGSKLAMAVCSDRCGHGGYRGIRVVTLATGATNSWTTRAIGVLVDVSWAGNGRVAFEWYSARRRPSPAQRTGLRLLSLTGAGRDLLAARAIGSPGLEANGYLPQALVTPDGNAVITSAVQEIPQGNDRRTVVAKIVKLSARTGRLLRVLNTVTRHFAPPATCTTSVCESRYLDCNVLSLGPAGVHALVDCFGFGRLDGSRFTPLPGPLATAPPGTDAIAAASAW